MKLLLGLLACLLATPVLANCIKLPAEEFAELDWGSAERFDQGEALMLMQGMMGLDDVASVPVGTITLWAMVVRDKVLIIRQVGPTTICSDDPIDRSTFETGKLRALPRDG